MTDAELKDELEIVILKHKDNGLTTIEAKEELVQVASKYMQADILTDIPGKFDIWNNTMADLAIKYNLGRH